MFDSGSPKKSHKPTTMCVIDISRAPGTSSVDLLPKSCEKSMRTGLFRP